MLFLQDDLRSPHKDLDYTFNNKSITVYMYSMYTWTHIHERSLWITLTLKLEDYIKRHKFHATFLTLWLQSRLRTYSYVCMYVWCVRACQIYALHNHPRIETVGPIKIVDWWMLYIYNIYIYIHISARHSPYWARASSLPRLHHHTQTHHIR